MNIKYTYPEETSMKTAIACHECDLVHFKERVPKQSKAMCSRCGAFLYQQSPDSINIALALNLSAFFLIIMANVFPFLTLEINGRLEINYFLSGALSLYHQGMGEVGFLVMITSVIFPLISIIGMLYLLFPLRFGIRPWFLAQVYRFVSAIRPWSLISVFMLGVLIAVVKLLDLAAVIPGTSFYSFIGLMVVLAAAHTHFDPAMIWPDMTLFNHQTLSGQSARDQGLISCHTCALLVPHKFLKSPVHPNCPRCQSPLHQRKVNSIVRTWALILSASLLFIPANIYPVMTVIQFGQGYPSTILSGVIHLIEGEMWILALIIFFASIVVPVLKLIVLSFLLLSVHKQSLWRPRDKTLLFRVTEIVGAWSMVDIYVVAILTGLVNMGALSTIKPGIGVAYFGAVVVVTMFAAHSFDPRLIWDNLEVKI